MDDQELRDALGDAMTGAHTPLEAADRLCAACVQLLDVDGASISYMGDGTMQGTFGSSGPLSRTLDELQFTYGQGPCLDAVTQCRPVLAPHLNGPVEDRWPALTQAILGHGIQAIFALPVAIASTPIGALDLYRRSSGPLDDAAMTGGVYAAKLAALPLLDLMTADTDWQSAAEGRGSWEQLESLERVEVYQATGMIIAALDVSPADALVRLRAHAISRGLTASVVAYQILNRRLVLDRDDWHVTGGDEGTT
ncbi:GAF and ANTAR domain-containing protein [Aquipuribacter sp. MA13-6]|uniref:GAF and ANTAR domain-containing protein n=1 Tax=unclassified Aquipuribacter TaxID=2635084 RepID=UPI003EE89DB6